jgi:tripartite-type tricarboxylate transporter receptor subunit TctC
MRLIFAVVAAIGCACALAQEPYPSKPIHIVQPFPPGGSLDILARSVAAKMSENWKVPVVVENRPGANTAIAADYVAKSAPDGYTILCAIDATVAMNPFLFSKLSYDPIKDFAPITIANTQPMVLAVNPALGVNSVQELIALAKAKPGQLSYAYGVVFTNIAGELFNSMAGVKMLGVGYKGGTLAMNDVIGGQVPVIFDALGTSIGHVRGGKVKGLAVTSARRHPSMPELPTLAESGLPGYDMTSWTGFLAPAATPRDTITRLHREMVRVLNLPELKERLGTMGMDVVGNTPEEFAQIIRADTLKYQSLIKQSNIPMMQ